MSPDVLRRKLQKKKKHKTYRKCPNCGGRSECYMHNLASAPQLWQECRVRVTGGCGFKKQLFWSGGGTADTYPTP